jgi:hypothetical protein
MSTTTSEFGTFQTRRSCLLMSVYGGTAENICSQRVFRILTQLGHRPSHLMSVGTISSSLSGRNFAEFPHLLCLSIASSSSSSDRGEMPSVRNPGKWSEAVVSICISST